MNIPTDFETTVEVNGIKISGTVIPAIIAALTRPDPRKWFNFRRQGNEIIVTTKLDDKEMN